VLVAIVLDLAGEKGLQHMLFKNGWIRVKFGEKQANMKAVESQT